MSIPNTSPRVTQTQTVAAPQPTAHTTFGMNGEQWHAAGICGLIVLAVVVIVLVGCAIAAVLAAATVERRQQTERFNPDTEAAVAQAVRVGNDEPARIEPWMRDVLAPRDDLAARRNAKADAR